MPFNVSRIFLGLCVSFLNKQVHGRCFCSAVDRCSFLDILADVVDSFWGLLWFFRWGCEAGELRLLDVGTVGQERCKIRTLADTEQRVGPQQRGWVRHAVMGVLRWREAQGGRVLDSSSPRISLQVRTSLKFPTSRNENRCLQFRTLLNNNVLNTINIVFGAIRAVSQRARFQHFQFLKTGNGNFQDAHRLRWSTYRYGSV